MSRQLWTLIILFGVGVSIYETSKDWQNWPASAVTGAVIIWVVLLALAFYIIELPKNKKIRLKRNGLKGGSLKTQMRINKKQIRRISAFLIIVCGICFLWSAVGLILNIVTGHSVHDFFAEEDGDSGLTAFKAEFWVTVSSTVLFFVAEGKPLNLRIFKDFPYKENAE